MTDHPRIGICLAVDGRRQGVRETLEEQIMNMTKAVAGLYTANLRYIDGTPVECVITDTAIGHVHEVQACADKFRKNDVGLTVTVIPCQCYGTETTDMDPAMPHAIWGFNGTERPGTVYLATASAGYAQVGIPAFGIYGKDVQDGDDNSIPEDVRTRLLDYATAGLAVAQMKGKSCLSVGGVAMGIAGSAVDPSFFDPYLGIHNEYIDMSEFIRRIEEGIYDPEEYEKAYAWIRENLTLGKNWNPEEWQKPEQFENWWKLVTEMTLIGRDLIQGNPRLAGLGSEEGADSHDTVTAGFQEQRQWTDHSPNGDVMETLLDTNFSWNGPRQPDVPATENGSLNGVSMLFNYLLTNTPQIFSNVRTYWSPEAVERVTGWKPEGRAAISFLDLRNSGSATLDGTGKATRDGKNVIKPWWEITEDDQRATLEATTFHPASTGYFRGGGFSTHFRTSDEMPVTMVRINLVNGKPYLQIVEGWTVGLPDEVATTIEERTNIEWPTTWFVPNLTGEGAFKNVYDVMNNQGVNHGAISYGHIGSELITFASMLRTLVNMHNVPEDQVFHPRAWSLFGTANPEGADHRACAELGPLYR